jgi:hypothetical protein
VVIYEIVAYLPRVQFEIDVQFFVDSHRGLFPSRLNLVQLWAAQRQLRITDENPLRWRMHVDSPISDMRRNGENPNNPEGLSVGKDDSQANAINPSAKDNAASI